MKIGEISLAKLTSGKSRSHNPCTWKLNDGINSRYRDHVKESYGNGGLMAHPHEKYLLSALNVVNSSTANVQIPQGS